MWTRSELKSKARIILKKCYWKAFLVSLLVIVTSGGCVNLPDFNYKYRNQYSNQNPFNFDFNFNEKYFNFDLNSLYSYIPNIALIIAIIIFALLIAAAIGVFVGNPIKVGAARFYISSSYDDINLNFLGYGFRKDRYFNVAQTLFIRDVFVFLWTLVFFIPGIVKHYSYSMTEYILADNPKMDYRRAIDISKAMTANTKFSIFLLDLSFAGWYILGALALGVGVLFVNPYIHATKMELYLSLRSKVIDNGICSPEEFGLILQN